MKILIFSIALSTLFFAACNNGTTKNQSAEEPSSAANNQGAPATTVSSARELVNNYLQHKDALTKDNDKDAATA